MENFDESSQTEDTANGKTDSYQEKVGMQGLQDRLEKIELAKREFMGHIEDAKKGFEERVREFKQLRYTLWSRSLHLKGAEEAGINEAEKYRLLNVILYKV